MLNTLMVVYREGRKEVTNYYIIFRIFRALRLLLFPLRMFEFYSMNLSSKLQSSTRTHDPLYFLVHTYYLSRQLTLRQRLQCAMNHHKFELKNYNVEYARRVYHSDGVLLWAQSVNDYNFTIVLIASDDYRQEGDLSVILSVDNVRLCRMSFCYLNADIFGLPSRMTLLISRNQSDMIPDRKFFTQCFKQNAPHFFCLSAVCGIAMANGFETVFGVKHDAQIAYDKSFESGFRNSYTVLWEKFEAVEVAGHVFELKVPLQVRALELVNREHRGRARDRRKYWNEIMETACARLGDYRLAPESEAKVIARGRRPTETLLAKIVARLHAKFKNGDLFKY